MCRLPRLVLWAALLGGGACASAEVVRIPAHLLPVPLSLDELEFFIWYMDNGMPSLAYPVAILGPTGEPPMLQLVFDEFISPWLGCLDFQLELQTPHCHREWYHNGNPWIPCDVLPPAEFEPMEWCACILGDLAVHPVAAVTDLRLSAVSGRVRLEWSPPELDAEGCTPVDIQGYEVHASPVGGFQPSPASLVARVDEPGWEGELTGTGQRFFRIVVNGQRALP